MTKTQRLQPIDKPRSLLVRLAFWISRRRLGKVMMPLRVVYARFPRLLMASRGFMTLSEDDRVVPARLRHLVSTWVSQLNGCGFCEDLHRAEAVHHGAPIEHVPLADFRNCSQLTNAEKAALAFAEEVTLYKRVEDATFAELGEHYSESQVVRLTWYLATVNYYNTMAVALGMGSDGLCAIALDGHRDAA